VTTAPASGTGTSPAIEIRLANEADLPACAALWRDALNDYMGRLNLPLVPDELAPIGRLHAHVRATDPDLFRVAVDADGQIVAFTAAVQRESVWFLSMLFVQPGSQSRGLGRRLLAGILPPETSGVILATCTDSAQPISNALYGSLGIVPRMPLVSLTGRPDRADALPALPGGIAVADLVPTDGAEVDELDRSVLGFAHPADHRYVAAEGRRGFVYRDASGALAGYGYTSAVGRVGPVAVRDEALLGPMLGHLLTAVEPRGASAVWVPGHADRAMVMLLRAGLRFDGFPVLACWSRAFADFARYLPISPGLL
jgi:predicted N-acetyltransferase YhbS